MHLRDPIHGSIQFSSAERNILDSVVYQRLRVIKQLGFSELSFPGATHNRYIHSVGVSHLAGRIFDQVFANYSFSQDSVRQRFRQVLRLAALLHDIGHGPLSHTTEVVMPLLSDVNVKAYQNTISELDPEKSRTSGRQANHEDYTIKFITDSSLTKILRDSFQDISPLHIACLVDKALQAPDDFFIDQGVNFRPILSQIVSSEMDADRMDYLERDAYFCGTNYGRVELPWLIGNITHHRVEDELYLALNRRALYTFDDFLLARHHMHLMVYFHHKSTVYEEMLFRYLTSPDCDFHIPYDISEYVLCNDYSLHQNMYASSNEWAQRISLRRPYKVLFELHSTEDNQRTEKMNQRLKEKGFSLIFASSSTRLSKYHSAAPEEKAFPIYVVDHYDRLAEPYPIEETTEIFQKYEEIRRIERLYVKPEQYKDAELYITDQKL